MKIIELDWRPVTIILTVPVIDRQKCLLTFLGQYDIQSLVIVHAEVDFLSLLVKSSDEDLPSSWKYTGT